MLTCIHRFRLQHIRCGAIRDDGIKPASSGDEGPLLLLPTMYEHVSPRRKGTAAPTPHPV